MDFYERMDLVHRLHTFWNPISEASVDTLLRALDPQPGMRVLDIACGVGELLVRMAERYRISGVGVDISRDALARARAKHTERRPDADLAFVEMDAKDYVLPDAGAFDIVVLVGASWIWDGYAGTLRALHGYVKPGGLVLYGEPYWRVAEPAPTYLEAEGLAADEFVDLGGLHDAVEAAGFRVLYQVGSTGQEWDEYEMLQSLAVDRWVREQHDHPDRDEVLDLQRQARERYLRWGRDTVGFTQMVLRRV